jgi:hypothetical protein
VVTGVEQLPVYPHSSFTDKVNITIENSTQGHNFCLSATLGTLLVKKHVSLAV